jgi:hypothetical protein
MLFRLRSSHGQHFPGNIRSSWSQIWKLRLPGTINILHQSFLLSCFLAQKSKFLYSGKIVELPVFKVCKLNSVRLFYRLVGDGNRMLENVNLKCGILNHASLVKGCLICASIWPFIYPRQVMQWFMSFAFIITFISLWASFPQTWFLVVWLERTQFCVGSIFGYPHVG